MLSIWMSLFSLLAWQHRAAGWVLLPGWGVPTLFSVAEINVRFCSHQQMHPLPFLAHCHPLLPMGKLRHRASVQDGLACPSVQNVTKLSLATSNW